MHKIKTTNFRKKKKAFAATKQKRGRTQMSNLDSPYEEIERLRRPPPGHLPPPRSGLGLGHGGSAEPNPKFVEGKPHPRSNQSGATKCYSQCQPVSISRAGEEDPNRAMNGQIGLAAHIPRANTEWTGRRIWV